MPSKSKAQARFMRAACHDKDFAEKNGIDQETACEYVREDEKEKEKEKQKSSGKKNKSSDW